MVMMLLISSALFWWPAAIFFLSLTLLININTRKKGPPLPPGPLGLPIIGNLLSLDPELHSYYSTLAQTYGPILSLKLGSKLGIIISSPALAKQVLKDHDVTFAHRDPPKAAQALFYGGNDIVWTDHGPQWRLLRKMAVTGMLGVPTLEAMYELRGREIRKTIRFLSGWAGRPVKIGEVVFMTMLNVITETLWGGRVQTGEEREKLGKEFREVVQEEMRLLGLPNVSDFFPGLGWLDLQGVEKKMKACVKKSDAIFEREIQNRLKMGEKEIGGKDFLQVLMQMKSDMEEGVSGFGNNKVEFSMDHLKALLMDLVNQMIELEKHFNTLELNLFGKSSANDVSQALKCKFTPSRYIQSLHAIHKAMVSQLAASQQLSEYLSRQMAVLGIKLSLEKQDNVKKQLFESIGISDHSDYPGFPKTGKVINSSSNKKLFVSSSDKAHNESRRNQLSSLSYHDPETARRRRDSLDRNWANFEAPKTTVKRMLVENQHQNVIASFSSLDKQLSSPRKLEPSTASCTKALPVRNRSGCMDVPKKLDSEDMASSIFKWAGEMPDVSRVQTEGYSRLQALQGSNYSAIQNSATLTSDLSSQSSSPRLLDLNIKKENNHSFAGVPWTERGHGDKSKSAIIKDLKPSESQNGYENSTIQRLQPKLLSSPKKCSEMPISALPSGGRSSLLPSTHDAVSSTSETPPMRLSSVSASSSSSQSVQALPFTSVEGGSITSAKTVKDTNSPMLQLQPSSSFASPSILHDSFFSSKDPKIKESHSMESSTNSVGQSPKIDPQPTLNKVGSDTPASPASTPLPPQKLESSVIDGLKFESVTPSARSSDIPKEAPSGSPHALSRTLTLASDVVTNTPSEKNSPAYTLPAATLSDSDGYTGGKNIVDAAVTQEDEMEEEAPEPNSTADLSLGGLAGFGLGSVPSTTASKSNPFGVSVSSATVNTSISISLPVPSGELFRPASFSFQSLQTSQQSQPASIGATSGAYGSGIPPQQPSSGGFGQPGQIGLGQAALGSVLGSFGQSRQFGAAMPGSGFGGNQSAGGFLNAPTGGGGFASVAPTGGGFAGLGTTASGFAAAGAGATGVGFAAAASGGGGFAGAASGGGGFGAFSKQGSSGFSGLGSGAGGGQPSSLFTQIRK